MKRGRSRTAYVIGSGPNGLTAAILLARAGFDTTVLEAQPGLGGGMRSEALTLPGFVHDVCSAVHPLAVSSPAFGEFPLAEHGLEWIYSPAGVAHPLDDGSAVLAYRSVEQTAAQLGPDARLYGSMLARMVREWRLIAGDLLAPPHLPKHPLALARFGAMALWPAASLARSLFRGERARALFAGMAGHAVLPLDKAGSAAFAWVLTLTAHAPGWPIPRGGSQSLANALASYFQSLGGHIVTGSAVRSLDELTEAGIILCDISPRQLLQIAGARLPDAYCRKLERFRYGPGAYKMDWALRAPIPWRAPECARAATVHLGGTLDEISASERAVWDGLVEDQPYTLVVQPSLFDSSRAPAGAHTAWGYCHVPNGSIEDMSGRIEAQIERFAPGFRDTILGRSIRTPADLERHNANLVGGDINGGAQNLSQLFLRPNRSLYRTPLRGVYLCSASTPPGGGVHGMCGYFAAQLALSQAGGN